MSTLVNSTQVQQSIWTIPALAQNMSGFIFGVVLLSIGLLQVNAAHDVRHPSH